MRQLDLSIGYLWGRFLSFPPFLNDQFKWNPCRVKLKRNEFYNYTVIVNAQETNYSTNKVVYPKGRLLPSELKLRDFVIWKEPVLKGFDQFFWKEA